jgi:hypothetical protein
MLKNTVYSRFLLNFLNIPGLPTDSFGGWLQNTLAGFGGVEPDGEVEGESGKRHEILSRILN